MVRDGGGVSKVSKVSHILRITTTIASFDTCEGIVKSVKCIVIVSLRRWLNEDGLGTGEGVKSGKSVSNIWNYLYDCLYARVKSVKSVQMVSLRR